MSFRESFIPWTDQPQETVTVSPEWASLLDVAHVGSGVVRRGATSGYLLDPVGSPSISPGITGIGPTFAGGRQSFSLGDVGAMDTGPFTIEVLCAITAAPALAGFFSSHNAGANGSARGLIAYGGGSNRNIYFWGSSADLASGVDWRTDGLLQHVFVTSGGSGTPMVFYRDGVQIASGTTPTLASRSSGGQWRVGDTENSWSSSPTGTIFLSAFYRSTLSAEQVRSRTNAVWQLFFPRPQRIWVPVSSGGAYNLTADSGNYSISGQTASIYRNKVLDAAQGSYSISGQDATITYTPSGTNYTITADSGSYSLSGQTASILRSKVLVAANGTYTLTGQSATVAYSGSNTITLKAGSWIRYRVIT